MNWDVIDSRLGGVAPKHTNLAGWNVLVVNDKLPIHDLVAVLAAQKGQGRLGILRLMAHGVLDNMVLCKEGLTPYRAHTEFQLLREVFDKEGLVALMGCNQVGFTRFGKPHSVLMEWLAEACGVHVLGSAAVQWYTSQPISFGDWEGGIYLCSPDGKWNRMSTPHERRTVTFKGFIKGRGSELPPFLLLRVWMVMNQK